MNVDGRALPAAIRSDLIGLFNAANWTELRTAAGRTTKRYPGQLLGWQALGKALLQLGKLPEAIDALSRAIELAPDDADAYNDLGTALRGNGKLNEAMASYRRAVELNPNLAQGYANLGLVLQDVRRFGEAASCCRRAIEIDPGSAIAHNNLGNALRELNQLTEADASYRASLVLQPDYLDALINSGTTLGELGRWAEAKSNYRKAVHLHPNSAVALSTLGQFLTRSGEDDDEARRCLERVIALDPRDASALSEMGNILMREKNTDAALVMFRRAQELRPLITWRANQEKADYSVVFLDTPMAGSTPVSYLAGRASYDRHFHCVIPDAIEDIDLLRAKGDVIFNMICNADDGEDMLPLALSLVERLGCPTVNHPRLIMNTNHETISRRLAGIPCCIIPRTVRVAGSALVEEAFAGFDLPLLVRLAGTHGGDDFDKFTSWADIRKFVSEREESNYYLTEYIDYRSEDGLFRKYRFIFIDGEIMPYHLAIHDDWKVHHFRTGMADHPWMRKEEECFLDDMSLVFNAAQQDALKAIAKATELDYGGIDCGLDRDGRIVVFEANASMLVHYEHAEVYVYKNRHIARIKDAFDAMLARRRPGILIKT